MKRTGTFGTRGRIAMALVAVVGLGLSSCGGGDQTSGERPGEDRRTDRPSAPDGGSEAAEPSPSRGSERVGTIEFSLPPQSDVPSGFRPMEHRCEASDGVIIGYAVPSSWDQTGSSRSGSGPILDGSLDHSFSTSEGDVEVSFTTDRRDMDGKMLDPDGEVGGSFDYEHRSGTATQQVRYERGWSTDVGGQTVTLWTIDEADYPDAVRGTIYQVRFEVYDVTWNDGGGRLEDTAVMALSAEAPLAEDVLKDIVGSVHLPECARRGAIVMHEIITSADLDGDGVVSEAQALLDLPS